MFEKELQNCRNNPRTGRKGALHRKETVRHAGTNEFAKPGF
jgi:hypothetical protein